MHFKKTLLTLITVSLSTLGSNAQWNESKANRICNAVEKEDWKSVHKQIIRLVDRWSYLDTSYGYPSYSLAMDSIVAILQSLPCSKDAYWDKCQVKISIYPGTHTFGVSFLSTAGDQEFCYTLNGGRMRYFGIRGVFGFPLKSKEELVFLSFTSCPGFIEEQMKLCE